jgi:hypothetical protein
VGQVVPQTYRILIYVGGCLGLDSILRTAVSILRDLGVLLLITSGVGGGGWYQLSTLLMDAVNAS